MKDRKVKIIALPAHPPADWSFFPHHMMTALALEVTNQLASSAVDCKSPSEATWDRKSSSWGLRRPQRRNRVRQSAGESGYLRAKGSQLRAGVNEGFKKIMKPEGTYWPLRDDGETITWGWGWGGRQKGGISNCTLRRYSVIACSSHNFISPIQLTFTCSMYLWLDPSFCTKEEKALKFLAFNISKIPFSRHGPGFFVDGVSPP